MVAIGFSHPFPLLELLISRVNTLFEVQDSRPILQVQEVSFHSDHREGDSVGRYRPATSSPGLIAYQFLCYS